MMRSVCRQILCRSAVAAAGQAAPRVSLSFTSARTAPLCQTRWNRHTADVAHHDGHHEQLHASKFEDVPVSTFALSNETKSALDRRGITTLFPIQAATFSSCFAGKDVVGRARTGTGKTLAFALPCIEKLLRLAPASPGKPGVLIILPTRELAKQVCDEVISVSSGTVTAASFYGGQPFGRQAQDLQRGVDVVVGTPGRLMDHLQRGTMDLSACHTLVLDEADRMLDMGFSKDIERIVKSMGNQQRQTLLFSATLPDWVDRLVKQFMTNEVVIDLIGESDNQTGQNIAHKTVMCPLPNRAPTVAGLIAQHADDGKVLVFVERKVDADNLAVDKFLNNKVGRPAVLHGDIPQQGRDQAMASFKAGLSKVLIATDIASRGLDVNGISLVINLQPPTDPNQYIHRSGRTARGGKSGTCITLYDHAQQMSMDQIRRAVKTKVCSFSLFMGSFNNHTHTHRWRRNRFPWSLRPPKARRAHRIAAVAVAASEVAVAATTVVAVATAAVVVVATAVAVAATAAAAAETVVAVAVATAAAVVATAVAVAATAAAAAETVVAVVVAAVATTSISSKTARPQLRLWVVGYPLPGCKTMAEANAAGGRVSASYIHVISWELARRAHGASLGCSTDSGKRVL